jgi:hypothetical protein
MSKSIESELTANGGENLEKAIGIFKGIDDLSLIVYVAITAIDVDEPILG